jgi:polyferredoxin
LWVVLRFSWFFGCCLVSFAGSILIGSLFSRVFFRVSCGSPVYTSCVRRGTLRFLFNKIYLRTKKKEEDIILLIRCCLGGFGTAT